MRRLVPLVLAMAACSPPPSPGEENAAIVGGSNETAAEDPGVVVIVAQVPSSMTATLCSASVVSPHVLLTAAHCLLPSEVGAGAQFFVYTGTSLQFATLQDLTADKVMEVHYDSKFSMTAVAKGNDVGVVILETALSIPPLPMNRDPITNADDNQPVRLVGYGQTMADDPMGVTAGDRREVDTTMVSHDDLFLHVGREGMTVCEGDSGGPAFMTLYGTEVIAGITSYGDTACDSYGFDTRVDKYADSFVQPYIDQFDPGVIKPIHHTGRGCAMGGDHDGGSLGALALLVVMLALQKFRNVRSGGQPRVPSVSRTAAIIAGMPQR